MSGFVISTHNQYYSGCKLKLKVAESRSVASTAPIFTKLATDGRHCVRFTIPNSIQTCQAVRSARLRVHLLT